MTERWRDIAGSVGVLDPGARNAITDVPGVRVGHSQAESGQRTGVTVIDPPALPAPAGVAVVNGTGVLNAYLEIDEVGFMRTPVYLCGTHAVGTVIQAAITESGHGPQNVVLPVVGECDDGDLADSRTTTAGDVSRALGALGPEVAEGSVGAGTGMILFDFPGGHRHRLAKGRRPSCRRAAALQLRRPRAPRPDGDHARRRTGQPASADGSCIAVCATDAPLSAQQLRRLALRPLLGLARAGSYGGEGSGEIGLAFTTDEDGEVPNTGLNPYFAAAYEAAHEAVLNCLVAARPAERLDGTMQDAFPVDEVRRIARERAG